MKEVSYIGFVGYFLYVICLVIAYFMGVELTFQVFATSIIFITFGIYAELRRLNEK